LELFSPKTIVSTASILGVTIGSFIGGSIIVNSRRKPILFFNLILIISSLVSIVDNFIVICIGRLVFGFATGILLVAAPKIIEETVPVDIIDYGFGTSTNLIINIGIMFNFMLGTLVPTDIESQKTNNMW
jgi:MFS family permease